MKNTVHLLILTFLVIAFSCTKEYKNPYDRECPAEVWSPVNLTAAFENGKINLTWENSENHFDGYWIEKSYDNQTWEKVNTSILDPSNSSFTDSGISGGKTVYYRIQGAADLNKSNYAFSNSVVIPNPPQVETLCPTNVGTTSATFNGNIISNGGTSITESGFYYSTSHITVSNPGYKVTATVTSGNFSKQMTSLSQTQIYYIVAFATNPAGTVYGKEITVATTYFSTDVQNFLINYMPIYSGSTPPNVEGCYLVSKNVLVYDGSGGYPVGEVFDDYQVSFSRNLTCNTTYDFYSVNYDHSDYEEATNINIQGTGNNFTCHLLTIGNSDGIAVKFINIYSGTKTVSGIQNFRMGWKIIYKGPDPTGKLVPVGTYRVFKDQDGLTENDVPWVFMRVDRDHDLIPDNSSVSAKTVSNRSGMSYK